MNTKLLAVLAGLAAIALSAISTTAYAANESDADEEELGLLEEIVVTAERREADLQKTPQFITVKTGAELKAEGKIRVEEILQGVAGLTMQNDNIGQDNNIFMRGISNGAAGVSITLDGVAQAIGTQSSAATYRFTTLDIAQVEVARGVQNGAGVSALSGAVSLVTNKPVFNFEASGSLTGGSHNMVNTEGVLNLPLADNQAVRLAFSTDERNAYYSGGLGETDNRAIRVRYRWQPSEKLDIGVSLQESRVGGASNGASGTLFSGHWETLGAASNYTYTYTNPWTGTVTTWGPQVAGRPIILSGNVLAGYASTPAATAAANTLGVGTLTASATPNVASNGQFYYPLPVCVANPAFTSIGTATTFATQAAMQTALAAIGPASALWGCPQNVFSVRDGTTWNNRSNPWDDGFSFEQFMNTPSFNGLNRQFSVTVDWDTAQGSLQLQPSLLYAKSYLVEPARGTGWMEGAGAPQKSYRLDTSFTSKMFGTFQYVLGLNASQTVPSSDGQPSGASARAISAATQPWVSGMNATTTFTGTNGVTPNGGVVSALNTNCYFALPAVNAAQVTQATALGTYNSTSCNAGSYSVGTGSTAYALTADLRYTMWNKLQLNGTIRYDHSRSETRNAVPGTLVDASGQRYVWVVPGSTVSTAAAAVAANPNAPYALPYRMNLSANDLQAIADAYPTFRRNYSDQTYTLNVQYDFTPSISAYARVATGTTASMNTNVSTLTPTSFLLTLPDAKVPVFSGNATAAAVARSGQAYQIVVTPPLSDTTTLLPGEQTRQLSAGLKSRWFDERLQFNIEAFYNQYTNRALSNIVGNFPTDVNSTTNAAASTVCNAAGTSPTSTTPFVIVLDANGTVANRGTSCFNMFQTIYTGDLLTKGIDLDLTWVPTVDDRLDITAELLRTMLNGIGTQPTLDADSLRPYVVSGTNDTLLNYYAGLINAHPLGTLGLQLANAPKLTVNTTYQHRFRLPNGAAITPRVQYNFTSAKFISSGGGGNPSTDANTIADSNWAIANDRPLPTVVPDTAIWNLFVSFQPSNAKWTANAYMNNVQNKAVLNSAFNLQTFSVGSRATNDLQRIVLGGNATLGAPRTYGVTISATL